MPAVTATAGAALSIIAVTVYEVAGPGAPNWDAASVAILSFDNLADPQDAYFADGMTDAVIRDLARFASIRVIARSSVMQYKNSRPPIQEIATRLDVGTIAEGSVQRTGGRMRLSSACWTLKRGG